MPFQVGDTVLVPVWDVYEVGRIQNIQQEDRTVTVRTIVSNHRATYSMSDVQAWDVAAATTLPHPITSGKSQMDQSPYFTPNPIIGEKRMTRARMMRQVREDQEYKKPASVVTSQLAPSPPPTRRTTRSTMSSSNAASRPVSLLSRAVVTPSPNLTTSRRVTLSISSESLASLSQPTSGATILSGARTTASRPTAAKSTSATTSSKNSEKNETVSTPLSEPVVRKRTLGRQRTDSASDKTRNNKIDRAGAERPAAVPVVPVTKMEDTKPAAKRKVSALAQPEKESIIVTSHTQGNKRTRAAPTQPVPPDARTGIKAKGQTVMLSSANLSSAVTATSTIASRKSAGASTVTARSMVRLPSTSDDDEDGDDNGTSDENNANGENNTNGNVNNNDANIDEDEIIRPVEDEDDHRFSVEYSPTSRATCRRCDELITKGTIRISHTPLFRGQQAGFTIYRHLHCAIFDETITHVRHVGGWRRLKSADLSLLAKRIQESLEEMKQEQEEIQPDELVQETFQGELRSPPSGLTADLLPFQVEGSSWMYCQEVKCPEIKGGILADEMGMGKTLQTIVTILDHRPLLQHSKPGAKHPPEELESRRREEELWEMARKDWSYELDMNNIKPSLRPKKLGGARAGTLVVCPVVALTQWKSELEKFASSLTVGIYHGPDRRKECPAEVMQKYDVVLTTYQVLEHDFRKMTSPNKVSCPNCGAKFKIDKLHIHLKYFCGDAARKTEAQARQQRTRDRHQGGNTGSSKGKKTQNKKPPTTSTRSKTKAAKAQPYPTKAMTKRTFSNVAEDSDSSEISRANVPGSSRRPSRSAAVRAAKRVQTSMKEWGAMDRDDESSYASGTEYSNKESGDGVEDMSIAESVESDPVERAREKQRQALDASNNNKKKKSRTAKPDGDKVRVQIKSNGKLKQKGKSRKVPTKGKKKFGDDGSSSSSSSDDESRTDDPMAGIDMNDLLSEAMAGSQFSLLHTFSWWRIILDEAHMIKSRSSQTAAAAFSLTSVHRWCLSGTPLQNRVSELYSLIRFLRIDPMAHYFCRQKGCDCKSLHYRMFQGICDKCGHRAFTHYAHFNRFVLNPIQRDGYSGDGRRAMFKLKNEVLDKCLLRRTKETRAADLALPPRLVTLRPIRLHPVEEDFYNALYTQTKASFDDYVAAGTLLNNYAHIFDLLTKMRQAVNHPYLIVYSKTNCEKHGGQRPVSRVDDRFECDICHEFPTDRVLSSCCRASFCRSCVLDYVAGAGGDDNMPCPSCRSPFSIDLTQESSAIETDDNDMAISNRKSREHGRSGVPSLKSLPHVATGSILRRINLAEFATSTKIEVLIQELIEMRKRRPGSKALVFSQFVNMLDLVRWRLHSDPLLVNLDLGVRILHGGMDVKSRDASLKSFREDPEIRVLLMSLKSAGVALNLTAASEVYLLDLWWNPAAEMQALDRVHRIGQYRPIRAVRFVAEGTVEERVLQLQEKKRLVFDGTVGRDAGSLKMLTAQDMKTLFT